MKIIHEHINKFVDGEFNHDVEAVRGFLNQMGAEVEGVEKTSDEDHVLDLEITPNRGDLLGYMGLVRELLAATKDNVKVICIDAEINTPVPAENVNVDLKEGNDCPVFCVRRIENVVVKQSPTEIQDFLTKNGIQPVNNLVDIGTYIMLVTGQPIHIYDADSIEGNINLRNSKDDESFTALNGDIVSVPVDSVVTSDDTEAILALVGVIGGRNSSITETTKNIIIESAYLNPQKIRSTSKESKVSTDASFRFERGTDPLISSRVLDYATELILKHCEGRISANFERNEDNYVPQVISLTFEKLERYMSFSLDKSFIINALEKLGFIIQSKDDEKLEVVVPSWRSHDVKRDVCLIEEIAKVYGIDNIPNIMPNTTLSISQRSQEQRTVESCERFFTSQGLNQAINYGFCSEDDFENLGVDSESELREFVTLNSPISKELSVMRTSLIPGLVKNFSYNSNRGQKNVRIFELGRVFQKPSKKEDLPIEQRRIAGLFSGVSHNDTWRRKNPKFDIHDIKAMIFGLFNDLDISSDRISLKTRESDFTISGISADLYIDNVHLGYFGQCVLPKKGIKGNAPIYIFELDLDKLSKSSFQDEITVENPSRFPVMQRDLSLDCPQGFSSESIIQQMKIHGGESLRNIRLMDVYEDSEKVGKGKVRLTFRLNFSSDKKMLTNDQVSDWMDEVIKNILKEQSVTLSG